MSDLYFVDTHVHYWDLDDPKLHYLWLAPGWIHPLLGDIREIKSPLYGAEQFIAETRNPGLADAAMEVRKVVHVQAALGIEDPVEETAWLQAAADRTGFPHAISAYVNLKDAGAEAMIERHMGFANLRGIRDFSDGDYLVNDDFHRGYALLGKHNLVCDLDCLWENMEKARNLALKFPDVTIALGHAGFPQERDADYFASWKKGMATIAEAPNVVCKISGLGMRDPHWTVESWRPWVLHCVETFGVDRCCFGTNWPVDRMYSSYQAVVAAYDELTRDLSETERHALFHGTAERVYRI